MSIMLKSCLKFGVVTKTMFYLTSKVIKLNLTWWVNLRSNSS